MELEWDPNKAAANLAKHGVPFEAAAEVFADPHHLVESDVFSRGEYRLIAIGKVDGRLLTVVFTERESEDVIRIISARLATPTERRAYVASSSL